MFRKTLAALAVFALVATIPFAFAANSSAAPQPCVCCTDGCDCDQCVCSELDCACPDGGPCVTDCCADCCTDCCELPSTDSCTEDCADSCIS